MDREQAKQTLEEQKKKMGEEDHLYQLDRSN